MRVKVLEAEAEGRTYTPMLSWYSHASFLDPFITLRKNRESLVTNQSDNSNTDLHEFTEQLARTASTTTTSSPAPFRAKRSRPVTMSIRYKIKSDTGELLLDGPTDGQPGNGEVIYDENVHTQGEYEITEEEMEQPVQIVQVGRSFENESEQAQLVSETSASDSIHEQSSKAQIVCTPPVEQKPVNKPVEVAAKDEISIFCELMDTQLRAMPASAGIETMCKIQQLVMEARLQSMRQ